MPERSCAQLNSPVGRAEGESAGDHLAKANSQCAQARQARVRTAEIFVIRKQLNGDRSLRREVILRGQLRRGFVKKLGRVGRDHVALFGIQS